MQPVVVLEPAREPARHAPSPFRLAALRQRLGGRRTREIGEGRKPSLGDRRHRDPPRCRRERALRRELPAPPVGREDLVEVAAGRREVARRDGRDARQEVQCEPLAGAGGAEATLTRLRVGTDVLAQEHGLCAGLRGDAHRFGHDLTLAHDQHSPARAQRGVEVGQRLEQEGQAIGRS